jgi:PPK2 family polyphosphate:nucleotide phosphotransferase
MNILKYKAKTNKKFKLKDFATYPDDDSSDKAELKAQLQSDIDKIRELQGVFFAHNRYSILMIFQAMDAAGKDGAIKHVMSGINPQGCRVTSFKAPSSVEYNHDFLWRHHLAMPEKGMIGIHNRSHYEFVLACKVNPELVLKERLPGIKKVEDIKKSFWEARYCKINQLEEMVAAGGTIILKFFLHLSKEEQKKRLLNRINRPEKNWKFEKSDLAARALWNEYMDAYEDAIRATNTEVAPWYIIPADDKWFARALIARILKYTMQRLDMKYPPITEADRLFLEEAKGILEKE